VVQASRLHGAAGTAAPQTGQDVADVFDGSLTTRYTKATKRANRLTSRRCHDLLDGSS